MGARCSYCGTEHYNNCSVEHRLYYLEELVESANSLLSDINVGCVSYEEIREWLKDFEKFEKENH